MRKLLFILAIFGLTTMVAFGQDSRSRENRQVSGFTGINASSVFNITVQKGNTESLVIEADDFTMPYVRSEVRDGVLHLYLDRSFGDNRAGKLDATIVMQNLEYVTLAGVNSLVVEDLFTPDRFRFNGRGVSTLSINLNTNQLEVVVSGVGNIEINANVSEHTRFNISGAPTISGNLISKQVVFDYSGAGSVTLTGSATNATINASGAPQLNLIDFPIREAVVNAPGAGNIQVNATDSLKINATGVSTVRYTGTTNVQIHQRGGMSRVSRLQN
jgi:hypothetical protein